MLIMKRPLLFLALFFCAYFTFAQSHNWVNCATNAEQHKYSLSGQAEQSALLPFSPFNYDEFTRYNKRVNFNIAVILIDFQDIPQNFRDDWPVKEEWERILFHSGSQKLFKNLSNDEFTLTGDVFGYFTSSSIYWDGATNTVIPFNQVLSNTTINISGFNKANYDGVMFVTGHDATLQASYVGSITFTINGQTYSENSMSLFYQNGRLSRNPAFPINNTLEQKRFYVIPLSENNREEEEVVYDLKQTETTFCHELGHFLGIGAHANSKTNGASFDYESEVPNNYNFYSREYGNSYDIMGTQTYSPSLNEHFRDYTRSISATKYRNCKGYRCKYSNYFSNK